VFLGLDAAKSFFGGRATVLTGTPVRPEIKSRPTRGEAAALFGLDPEKTTILVTGGSQGARRLNELCAGAVAKFPEGIQVLHIAGALDFDRVSQIAGARAKHRVIGFCDRMAAAYAVADLIISRSGASSLTEVSIAGLPSILVPFPYAADDHQTRNAEVFERAGAAKLVQERDLDEGKLAALALSILNDPAASERMAAAARALAIPDAAERVCAAIEATFSNP
jgi:UDP-N-acetylglucosamine--N-acetylmuramyl-(pentapeptide) pyrophosphoryl-undecaprenol N-acetylglucosamine transferase